MASGTLLVVHEVELHPNSVIPKIKQSFEKPSILNITTRDGLRAYNKPPLFDSKYLVLFESQKVFESNVAYLHFEFMFPAYICSTKQSLADIQWFCQEKGISCKIYDNEFNHQDAFDLIRTLASVRVSDDFCKSLLSRVKLSPRRIVSAVMVCEQVGYTTENIGRYIDKYVYIDSYDVIESLLGICKSQAQRRRAACFINTNRVWYHKYTRKNLIKEVDILIKVYKDFLDGKVTIFTLQEYIDSEHISRYRILYVRELMGRVSIHSLMALKQFLSEASILEVAMKLS